MSRQKSELLNFSAVRVFTVFLLLLVLALACGAVTNKIRRDRQWARFKMELSDVEIPPSLKAEILVLLEPEAPDGKQLRLAAQGIDAVMPNEIGSVVFMERSNKLWKSAYDDPVRLPSNIMVGGLGSFEDLWGVGEPVHCRFRTSFQAFIPLKGYPGKVAIYAIKYLKG